ncbi:uncharacterized protein LY79DRAFT_40006 [Colletotrichum navitas]|uniref:Uncharacterized protein n=1 Tax=Colletotrichum navitas TaxID=681940 RepID=A0AAD8PNE3_9PEZI|nr:uncharacterized protein LY79DRAFT_40006 [Colletotrichum navitas]KAK1572887.1 hypothetical protein LY79DRAFT_40006 [Colletotrichum navitas]
MKSQKLPGVIYSSSQGYRPGDCVESSMPGWKLPSGRKGATSECKERPPVGSQKGSLKGPNRGWRIGNDSNVLRARRSLVSKSRGAAERLQVTLLGVFFFFLFFFFFPFRFLWPSPLGFLVGSMGRWRDEVKPRKKAGSRRTSRIVLLRREREGAAVLSR